MPFGYICPFTYSDTERLTVFTITRFEQNSMTSNHRDRLIRLAIGQDILTDNVKHDSIVKSTEGKVCILKRDA